MSQASGSSRTYSSTGGIAGIHAVGVPGGKKPSSPSSRIALSDAAAQPSDSSRHRMNPIERPYDTVAPSGRCSIAMRVPSGFCAGGPLSSTCAPTGCDRGFPHVRFGQRARARAGQGIQRVGVRIGGRVQERIVHALGPDARVEIELVHHDLGQREVLGHLLDGRHRGRRRDAGLEQRSAVVHAEVGAIAPEAEKHRMFRGLAQRQELFHHRRRQDVARFHLVGGPDLELLFEVRILERGHRQAVSIANLVRLRGLGL